MINAILAIWAATIVLVAVLWPQRLMALAIVSSVFEGAAVVKAGGFGVAPYYLTLLLIAARCVWLKTDAKGFFGHTPRVRAIMLCAVLFAGVAVAGAFILPRAFAGWTVLSMRLDSGYPAPLSFSASNIGQSVYLLLNTALLWYIAQQAPSKKFAAEATNAVLIAGAIVIGLALYQFAAALTGLPFPDDVLYSNDSYTMQNGSTILDMPRISSTFTEPAGLAVFLLGFTAFLTSECVGIVRKPAVRWVLLLGSVAVLILCTSSTGYIGLAAISLWRIWTYIIRPAFKGTWNPRLIAAVLCIIAAVAVTIAVNDQLRSVIQAMVFDKDESSSYAERSAADSFSANLAISTLGMGVGLGSNRASSFLNSMLSTVGVPGFAIFSGLVILLIRKSISSDQSMIGRHVALASAVIGIIGAKVLTSPDMASPCMWAMMAALLCVHSAAEASETTANRPTQRPAMRKRSFASFQSAGVN